PWNRGRVRSAALARTNLAWSLGSPIGGAFSPSLASDNRALAALQRATNRASIRRSPEGPRFPGAIECLSDTARCTGAGAWGRERGGPGRGGRERAGADVGCATRPRVARPSLDALLPGANRSTRPRGGAEPSGIPLAR